MNAIVTKTEPVSSDTCAVYHASATAILELLLTQPKAFLGHKDSETVELAQEIITLNE